MPYTTARDIVHKKRDTDSVDTRPGPPRPRKRSLLFDLDVCHQALDDRFKSFSELGAESTPQVTPTTIRNILKDYGLNRRRARKVIRKTERTRVRRYDWALDHEAWTVEWEWVIWSDECYIVLGAHPGVVWVTRSDGEEFDDDCTAPYDKQTDRRVMVWGCIARDSKGPLVVLEYPGGPGGGMDAARYREQVCCHHHISFCG
jgi:hypothetical protein